MTLRRLTSVAIYLKFVQVSPLKEVHGSRKQVVLDAERMEAAVKHIPGMRR